ncbi:MAG: hypothetical protein ABIA04_11870 [Pseudomonadota bacterium]
MKQLLCLTLFLYHIISLIVFAEDSMDSTTLDPEDDSVLQNSNPSSDKGLIISGNDEIVSLSNENYDSIQILGLLINEALEYPERIHKIYNDYIDPSTRKKNFIKGDEIKVLGEIALQTNYGPLRNNVLVYLARFVLAGAHTTGGLNFDPMIRVSFEESSYEAIQYMAWIVDKNPETLVTACHVIDRALGQVKQDRAIYEWFLNVLLLESSNLFIKSQLRLLTREIFQITETLAVDSILEINSIEAVYGIESNPLLAIEGNVPNTRCTLLF